MKFTDFLRVSDHTSGILNRFRGVRRRNVVFFDEVLAEYIAVCEKAGYGKEVYSIGKEWGSAYSQGVIPPFIRKIPRPLLLNNIMGRLWRSMDLLDGLDVKEDGRNIEFKTSGECVTRTIGKNALVQGLYNGVLSVLCGYDIEDDGCEQTKEGSVYRYRISRRPFSAESKGAEEYTRMNFGAKEGAYSLQAAYRDRFFTLKGNKSYLKGAHIQISESTLFHIIGNRGPMINGVAKIASGYLRRTVGKMSEDYALKSAKMLIEAGGWGKADFLIKGNSINLSISNPPYGFQTGKDNWKWLSMNLLGYISAAGEAELCGVDEMPRRVSLAFSLSKT